MPDNADVHGEALRIFDTIYDATYEERQQCLQDRRFYSIAGAQWEGALKEQFENRPMFEVNKVHRSVIRIFNDYRNNRFSVDFIGKDDTPGDKLAEVCDGLYRADEQDSGAEEAYDNAFEEAVGGGMGAWRLRTEYEDPYDEDDERLRIRIEPIYDADQRVYFDLDSKRQDKSDATHCFVLTPMTHDKYEELYDESPSDFQRFGTDTTGFDWVQPDLVYVAEYYRVEESSETIRTFQTLDGNEVTFTDTELEADEEKVSMLNATGAREIKSRKVRRRKVRKYILSGNGVLEDEGHIAGRHIPVVPVYGKRWYVENIERCMGNVRLAKDPQRLKNMQLSKLAEIAASSSVEKPIFTPEQVAGHETNWAEDNISNFPFLLVNPIFDASGNMLPAGPVAYTKPAQMPQTMAALLQLTEADIADIQGNPQQGEKLQANVSAKAIELVQTRLDAQSYIYVDNMRKSIKRSGEVWLGMAPDVFVEERRKVKAIDGQDKRTFVELNVSKIDDKGEIEWVNSFARARFEVTVTTGPTSQSQREAAKRSYLEMMQYTKNPEMVEILTAAAVLNTEGEGVDFVHDYARKTLIKMGAIQPTDDELQDLAEQMQAQQPSPQDAYLQAAAEAERAKAQESQADVQLKLARAQESQSKARNIEAETLETMTDIGANVGPGNGA